MRLHGICRCAPLLTDNTMEHESCTSSFSICGAALTCSVACADVQMLLADIAMEQESFDSAAADYAAALGLLAAALGPDDRRLAEAHYKHALALQFLDEPEKALQSAKVRAVRQNGVHHKTCCLNCWVGRMNGMRSRQNVAACFSRRLRFNSPMLGSCYGFSKCSLAS